MNKNIKEIIYIAGVVTNNTELLKLVEDGYPNVYCHHMTIKYGNITELPEFIGAKFNFNSNLIYKDVSAIAITGKIDNSSVKDMMNKNNQRAHITICTADGIRPIYSNVLIKTEEGEELNIKVHMIVGAFCIFEDGTKDWVYEK